jgi:nitroimidazol reductase NimA-like FMN-containing flavoprotein (pyridoxamine 5'-phosphate oxidase superfamily)
MEITRKIPVSVVRSTAGLSLLLQVFRVPCSWGMNYQSFIGYGRARCIGDTEEKKHALQVIFGHYRGKTEEVGEFPPGSVSVFSTRIESMTG